jgi:hypothetical protein
MSDLNRKRIGRPRLDRAPQGTRDGKLQAELIAHMEAVIPGLQTKRWRQKVRDAFTGTEEVEHVEDDFWSYLCEFAYIPDAFVIDKAEMRLDFFEVEVTSLMTDTKLRAYAEFKTIMDYYGIEFSLFSVNQHGHINEVFLLPHYVNWLKGAYKAAQA